MSLKTGSRREKNEQTDAATCAAGKPERLNLGCGTLVVLFILIATAGKLIPHREKTSRTEKNAGEPAISQPGQTDGLHEPPAQAPKSVEKPRTNQPSRAMGEAGGIRAGKPSAEHTKNDGSLTAFLSNVERYVVNQTGLATGAQTPVRSAAKPPSGSPQVRQDREAGHGKSANQSQSPEGQGAEPESSAVRNVHSVQQGSPGDGSPASGGKPLVFNSPWDNSVEQVDRYLKRHTHDADSVQILEWGKVKPTHDGYQVRCTFKSKNVLGNIATLNKLFLLDRRGEVTDIRD